MAWRLWTIDLAREQAPTLDHLYYYASSSLDAGYDTLGLYLEHRFAYPSASWAQGTACVTPEMIKRLRSEFPSLTIVPFINLLGHMEGFLNCEQGSLYRESPFRGMQGCPSNPDFKSFSEGILNDTLDAFDSQVVHIGGDETRELGKCAVCATKNKAQLYADHFAPLAAQVVAKGRRPALWGDMFLDHPEALASIPKEAFIFDWQYHNGLKDTTPRLQAHGHEIVGCPTIHAFDAAWIHARESEDNIRVVCQDAKDLNLAGVCLTTWEQGLFGAYDSLLPAVSWARQVMDNPEFEQSLTESFGEHRVWAELMGRDLNDIGGVFAFDGHRHRLKSRLLLYSNPFLAWFHHRHQLAGDDGDAAIDICERAILNTQDLAFKGVALFVRAAVEFVRIAEASHLWYAEGEPEKAIRALAPARHAFDTLETVAKRTHERTGGSLADIERCRVAKQHIETVMRRVQKFGRGELGYTPSFDTLCHTRFVPHDQACWWGVNKWGDE